MTVVRVRGCGVIDVFKKLPRLSDKQLQNGALRKFIADATPKAFTLVRTKQIEDVRGVNARLERLVHGRTDNA